MALETKQRLDEKAEGLSDGQEKEKEISDRIERAIGKSRKALEPHHALINATTRNMYEQMFDDYRVHKNVEWAEESTALVQRTVEQALGYQAHFEGQLTAALSKGWISSESCQRWIERFNDPNLLECTRSEFVRKKFPSYVKNWGKNAERREKLRGKFKGIMDAEDNPLIGILEDKTAFLKLDYDKQVNLLNMLEALEAAGATEKKALYMQARAWLAKASAGERRCLHPEKTGALLKEMMNGDKPERFLEDVLEPMLGEYADTRAAFDAFRSEMESAENVSFKIPSLDTFLRWDNAKRSSYVEEGRRRIAVAQEKVATDAEKDRQLGIRLVEKRMDMGDWKGAEIFLADAMATYANDKDLLVIERYLATQRTDFEEDEKAEQSIADTKKEIDDRLKEIPFSARGMYALTIEGGSEQFGVMVEGMYNGAREPSKKKPEPKMDTDKQDAAWSRMMHIVAEGEKRDDPEAEEEDVKTDEEPEDIVLETRSKDDEAEALESLTSETLLGGPEEKSLTIADVSAEQQMLYHTQVNIPVLNKLRFLESKGERYEMAA